MEDNTHTEGSTLPRPNETLVVETIDPDRTDASEQARLLLLLLDDML